MITVKLKLKNEVDVKEYQRQFSCVVRYCYNRYVEKVKDSEIEKLCKSLKNVNLLDASMIKSARLKALEIYSTKHSNICFGGKFNFKQYSTGKISKEQFKNNRLLPIYCIGSKCDKGNRKFKLDIIQNNKILFKPSRNTSIELNLCKLSKNQKELLFKLEENCKQKLNPVTISLTNTHVYLTFDECIIQKEYTNFKSGRILSLDLNPNYIGVSICDYKNNKQRIIHKEIISNKLINDINTKGLNSKDKLSIYKSNKRNFECFQVSKYLVNLCKQFHCEYLTFEKLNINSKNHQKGRSYNRLVNNHWNRTKFLDNLKKLCNINSIKHQEILSQYSSFVGCLTHPTEIDSVAASLEINRRSNLFVGMYKIKNIQADSIVFPKDLQMLNLNKWKDEGLTVKDCSDWKTLYSWFKNSKLSYRILFDVDKTKNSLRLNSNKSLVNRYFI